MQHKAPGTKLDQALRQLKATLGLAAMQAEQGHLFDGDEVFDELRELIEERRLAKKKARRS